MKKSILNLGTVLNKEQQRTVTGGARICDHRIGKCYHGKVPSDPNTLVTLDSEGVYHIH